MCLRLVPDDSQCTLVAAPIADPCYVRSTGRRRMKAILTVLGVVFLIVAAMYFLVPAESLPTFFPGHETGLMRIRAKHGMLTGAIGIVLLIASWFTGRR